MMSEPTLFTKVGIKRLKIAGQRKKAQIKDKEYNKMRPITLCLRIRFVLNLISFFAIGFQRA
ncbi:unnamed protein product, partial [marine sediment metagenome]